MSLITRSIPGLFGGVSQQIPAMRHATHASEQLNGFCTLVEGLYKRPGTKRVASLPVVGTGGLSVSGSYGNALVHMIDKGTAGLYALVLVNGNMMLFNANTGAAVAVDTPNGLQYLGTADPGAMRCVTVADYTFIVNPTRVPTLGAVTDTVNPVNVGYINVKTAVPNVSYTATVNGQPVTVSAGATATNSGTASSLAAAINALADYTAYVLPSTNIIKVVRDNGTAFPLAASDGWGNQALQVLSAGVDKYSDLPSRFETGYAIKITGSAESSQDPYYVRWDGDRWVETRKPAIADTLVPANMPHQLRQRADGTWVFEQAEWGKRLVGDDETNPVPSFVGSTIRGVFFFRNRLGFLSQDGIILSRAGQYFNFWASTANQVLDTDPIDLASPVEQVETLDWAVPYNQSLIVWATKGQQFILTADEILSPKNARLLPSTTFESYGGCKPASLGNRVLFPSNLGENAAVSLYRVSEDQVTNTAEEMTEHVPNYVPANPREIAASTTVKAAVVVPSGVSNTLKLFKYEIGEQDRMSQKAWHTITVGTGETTRIMKAYWVSRKLYLVLHVESLADPVVGGRFVIETLDFEATAKDLNLPFALCLDSRQQGIGGAFNGTSTTLTLPGLYGYQPTILKCVSGVEPELLTVTNVVPNSATMQTTFTLTGNHTGAVLWAGRPFTFRYVFTEVVLRDQDGVPVQDANVKVVRYLLRYVASGIFKAIVKPILRGTYEYPFNGRTVGRPGQGPSQLSLSTGTFAIPVQTRAAEVEVAIESDSYLPCKFPYAEWVGDVTMKASR